MRYMLDSDVVGALLADCGPVWSHFRSHFGSVGLSAIAVLELRCGIAKSRHAERNLRTWQPFTDGGGVLTVPFDDDDAAVAGLLRQAMTAKGRPMGAYDLLIAAQALRRGRVLVTREAGFAEVDGLTVEDWSVG